MTGNRKGCIRVFALLALIVIWVQASEAMAWWDEKWQYRRKITIDTSTTGVELQGNASDFPFLIRLHTGNFNFANAKEDGSDIRFVNTDDKEPLKYHIESYDPADEMALVWVRIPRLAGGNAQQTVWLYFGNKAAPAAQDKGGVYDVNALLVYHMAEADGAPPKDQTAYNNHAAEFTGQAGLDSIIGKGIGLSGGGEKLVLPKSSSLDFSKGFTFSTWIKIPGAQQDAHLFSWMAEPEPQAAPAAPGQAQTLASPERIVIAVDQAAVYAQVVSREGWTVTSEKTAVLTPETWHFLAVSAEPSKKISVYLDGTLVASSELPGALPIPPTEISIGASLKGTHALAGELDELQISRSARPAGYLQAAFISQGPSEGLVRPGDEEVGSAGGLPVFYFKTIIKNLSLDGWVICGFLTLFGAASCVVFLRKAVTLWLMERENTAFLRSFVRESDPLALEGADKEFPNSCLYAVYRAGLREIEACAVVSENPGHKVLSARGLKSFNAALDRAFVMQSKQLNAWLIFLTMAIAGGPFLGLLGTVWGVMNTFAAMAEAGEANLAAIAPGIASALATTVFGLIVAIPALFAYNYLVTKVKGVSLELNTFVDEYSVKVETAYGGNA